MFWRFGFHNASSIDSLLDKEDVPLEAILDEDDLLQECKSQNTRLIDYFGRVPVLHRLLAYVTGDIESEDKGRFKYPYVATEVLCSDIWSIVETCLREQHDLLAPFWESVLDRSPDDMKTQMVMASHFAKINAVFLNKKPAEMLAFVQSQPSIVERLLRQIETPSFVDLLVQIIQLDEQPGGGGVLEWLSSENFIGRLIDMLAPAYSSDIHTIVTDLIKGIISMATPSPAAGLTDAANGPASNLFARELASQESIAKLASYIVHDFGVDKTRGDDMATAQQLPTLESSVSSVVNSISIIIELIRKNNSDYFEPYLFHTLRNRLIQLQQHLHGSPEETREILEQAMKDMVNRMGVVHLGPVLDVLGEKMANLKHFLHSPRSLAGDIQTTVGSVTPLTFERFRICELFAELLHCSNMALLNRPAIYDHLYDSKGRLQGGLSALEDLAQVIALNGTSDTEREQMDETSDIEPALELPISGSHDDSPSIDSEDMTDSSGPESSDEDGDDGALEEIAMYDEPSSVSSPPETGGTITQTGVVTTSPVEASSGFAASPVPMGGNVGAGMEKGSDMSPGGGEDALTPQPSRPPMLSRSSSSRRSSRKATGAQESVPMAEVVMTSGNKLKQWFLDLGLLPTLLDLFFEFRWNNFLHSAVYDVIHQILTGNVEGGLNRELAISLFRDAKLMGRIVEGQKLNDVESAKPKGVRIGYMGHLTLLAEDVIISLERFPPDLRIIIDQYAPEPEWEQYVTGRFSETKQKDSHLLGGGKPVVGGVNGSGIGKAGGLGGLAARWKVDEDDADVPEDVGSSPSAGVRGEFRRVGVGAVGMGGGGGVGVGGGGGGVRNTADFGSAPIPVDEDEDEDDEEKYGNSRTTHFARYLAQEIQSSNHIGESSDSSDEEEGGWLSQSTFTLGSPPISARRQHGIERRPLDVIGFDDAFHPSTHNNVFSEDPFASHDDDGFGPFSDAAAITHSDSILISSSSFSDEMDDSSFESFGDFGEFQSAEGSGGGGGGDVDLGPGFGGPENHNEGGGGYSHRDRGRSGSGGGRGAADVSTGTIRIRTTGGGDGGGSDGEGDGDGDGNESMTLTPTAGGGSWTFASGHDGFEEIRRV